MRSFCGMFAPLLGLLILGSAGNRAVAADVDKAKLIGAWELILPEEAKGLDIKVVIEFTNDGKAKMSFEGGGKKDAKDGTWKLDGDKLTITPNDDKEKAEAITVKSLTADKMTVSDKGGKDMSFKKRAK